MEQKPDDAAEQDPSSSLGAGPDDASDAVRGAESPPSGDPAIVRQVADGVLHALDPRYPRVERIGWWIMDAILGVPALVAVAVGVIAGWFEGLVIVYVAVGWLLGMSLLLWATIKWPDLVYARARWVLTPIGLEIRRGVIWRSVTNLPRSRVQHTDVTQGPLLRRFGLATLIIHTAGTDQASVQLPGLSEETALRVRDFLIERGERGDR